jgi:seryl-tRNA synthetase
VSPDLKTRRKQILSDPVAVFSALRPDADENKVAVLTTLWQQLQSLKKQRKATQAQSKRTSRKIGEAKRNGEPIDEF